MFRIWLILAALCFVVSARAQTGPYPAYTAQSITVAPNGGAAPVAKIANDGSITSTGMRTNPLGITTAPGAWTPVCPMSNCGTVGGASVYTTSGAQPAANQLVFPSVAGITVGQYALQQNIPANTTVTGVSGLIVTISAPTIGGGVPSNSIVGFAASNVLGGQTVSAIQAIAPSNSIQTGYVTAVDGLYVNTGQRLPSTASDQDVGRYIGVVQGPFGGNVWALNTDVVRNGIPNASYYAGVPSGVGSSSPGTPGAIPAGNGTVEAEFDLTNWDQDCLTGAQPSFCVGLYLTNAGKYASWSAIYLDQVPEVSYPSNTITGATWSSGIVTFTTGTAHGIGVGDYATVSGVAPSGYNGNFVVIATPTTTTFTVAIASNPGTKTGNGTLAAYSNYGWHNGIWFNGSNIDKDNDILLQTNANAGITVQGSHALADMVAGGNSTYGFLTGGTHSAFEIYAQGSAPSGVGVVGTRTGAGFNDGTTSPYGYYENGTHSTADFYSVGTSNYGMYLGGTYTTAALIAGGTQVNGIISQPSNVGGTSTDFYANGATAIGLTVNGTHTNSDIYVPGIGPAGVNVVGTHSSSAYQENATSAVGFNASGIHATYGDFYSGGTSVYGVRLVGTYSGAAISMTNGFKECFNGTTDCLLHTGSVLAYQPSGSTVASISDTGALALSGTATITDATDSGFGLTLAATGTGGRTFQILATQNGNGVGNGVLDFYDTNASASRLSINQYGVGINTTAQASGNALTVIGNLVASTYTVGSTNGVSCSGTPTASFASVSGIVTHC